MSPSLLIPRATFCDDDPLWQASVSQRDGVSPVLAWLDLVSLAASADCEKTVGGDVIPLKRGEVVISVRHLARRWNWGGRSGAATGRVRRFLDTLVRLGRIERVRATERGSVVRIVGYDEYSPASVQPAKPLLKPETPQLVLIPHEEKPSNEYPPEFEEFWQAYPKREGGNSKRAAFRRWQALRKRGVSAADLLRAARGYAAEQERLGNIGTRFVKQCSTFLGPDEHWRQYVTADATSAQGSNKSPTPPRTPHKTLDGYAAAEVAEKLARESVARLQLAV